MADAIQDIFGTLLRGGSLSQDQAERAFMLVLDGKLDDAQIGGLLALMATRGASVEELVGATLAVRRHATAVEAPPGLTLVDTCGTGGAPKTFNVSTISAIVIAAAGQGLIPRVGVAKHGNRSRTGRGSAEALEALGMNISASPAAQARSLREIGVCFSFAPGHHQAARHASTARRSLGFATIFNLIGPLANPAGVRRQLMGTWTAENAGKLAESLRRLGAERAMVFSSDDGMDELTTTSVNRTFVVERGSVAPGELDATKFGFRRASIGDLSVSSLEEAARVFAEILGGAGGPRTDQVLLNAGAGIWIGGGVGDIGSGIAVAREAIASGRAKRTLAEMIRLSHET